MTLIDWDRLMSLRDDIGVEDFADVAFVFFAEIGGKLGELVADPSRARAEDFHFLRGSAANLGFAAMALSCEVAEKACREGRPPDIEAVSRSFFDALAEARPRLPELSPA